MKLLYGLLALGNVIIIVGIILLIACETEIFTAFPH
jgi:hypothetical protein